MQILAVCLKIEERAVFYSIEKHRQIHHGLLRRMAVVSLRTLPYCNLINPEQTPCSLRGFSREVTEESM